jgi:hypothetical protein
MVTNALFPQTNQGIQAFIPQARQTVLIRTPLQPFTFVQISSGRPKRHDLPPRRRRSRRRDKGLAPAKALNSAVAPSRTSTPPCPPARDNKSAINPTPAPPAPDTPHRPAPARPSASSPAPTDGAAAEARIGATATAPEITRTRRAPAPRQSAPAAGSTSAPLPPPAPAQRQRSGPARYPASHSSPPASTTPTSTAPRGLARRHPRAHRQQDQPPRHLRRSDAGRRKRRKPRRGPPVGEQDQHIGQAAPRGSDRPR